MSEQKVNRTIYISGPMTGKPDLNKAAFYRAEARLKAAGFIVLNPASLPDGLDYCQYMQIDMTMLAVCNCIYLLNGHEHSKGAIAERAFAHSCCYEEFFEDKGDFIAPITTVEVSVHVTDGVVSNDIEGTIEFGADDDIRTKALCGLPHKSLAV